MQDTIITVKDRTLRAELRSDIDHHGAGAMREMIDRALFLHKPDVLIIDFSGVGFMDSSGIGLILGRVESAAAVGASVRVCGMSPTLMKIVRLSGLDRVRNLTLMKSNIDCEVF